MLNLPRAVLRIEAESLEELEGNSYIKCNMILTLYMYKSLLTLTPPVCSTFCSPFVSVAS
jgi:hypothetical protein